MTSYISRHEHYPNAPAVPAEKELNAQKGPEISSSSAPSVATTPPKDLADTKRRRSR